MNSSRTFGILAAILCLVTPCLAHHMAVVTDKDNKTQNVTSANLAKIIRGEVKKWPDGTNIILVLHQSSPGEIGTLARLTKMTEAAFKSMVADHSVRKVATDAEVIEAVSSTPGAIGMVEEHSITDRVNVIKVDGKLPLEAGYLPH